MKKAKKQSNRKPKPTNHLSELARELFEGIDQSQLELEHFTPVSEMPSGQPWDLIRECYAQRNLKRRVMALILNGIESSRKLHFLLSKDILEKYFTRDPNFQRDSINGTRNKQLMNELLAVMNDQSFLKCVRKWEKLGPNQFRAGTYTIGNPKVIATLGEWAQSDPTSGPHLRTPEYEYEYEPEFENEGENEIE